MFALELLTVLPSLGMRGPRAWIELAVHGLVAIVCAVAGRMIRMASASAPPVAVFGIVARAATGIQSLFWTALPSDVAPGTHGPLAALACVNAMVWLGVVYWTRESASPASEDPGATSSSARSFR
jgi:hypothetical protein